MKVALLGCSFTNGNLGCVALTCSLIRALDEAARLVGRELEYVVFEPDSDERHMEQLLNEISEKQLPVTSSRVGWVYNIRAVAHPLRSIQMMQQLKKCDVAVDLTGGDSFSDIYGRKRFDYWSNIKRYIIKNRIPLVLGPQTYGPFSENCTKKTAKEIVEKAYMVISRDEKSVGSIREFSGRRVHVTTDLAFLLPSVRPQDVPHEAGYVNVGFNVSGLLYANDSDQDHLNSALSCHYETYVHQLIGWMLEQRRYRIFLISHVSSDVSVAQQLAEKYPDCVKVPFYADPMQMKGIISQMDVFIGSRMHAAIAAFSSGVATIPVAYSRKFSGVFERLGYDVNVDLALCTTEEAFEQTMNYLVRYQNLTEAVGSCKAKVIEYSEKNIQLLAEVFSTIDAAG